LVGSIIIISPGAGKGCGQLGEEGGGADMLLGCPEDWVNEQFDPIGERIVGEDLERAVEGFLNGGAVGLAHCVVEGLLEWREGYA